MAVLSTRELERTNRSVLYPRVEIWLDLARYGWVAESLGFEDNRHTSIWPCKHNVVGHDPPIFARCSGAPYLKLFDRGLKDSDPNPSRALVNEKLILARHCFRVCKGLSSADWAVALLISLRHPKMRP